jgi:hypothetical protein
MRCLLRDLVAACAALLVWGGALAGPATLDAQSVAALKGLIKNEPSAAQEFSPLRKMAEGSLSLQPTTIARVVSEGRLANDPEKVASGEAMRDVRRIEALAWTAIVTDDERYVAKAKGFILAWARVNRSEGNPINESQFEPVVEAYDLLRPKFSSAERAVVDEWLRDKAKRLWESTRHREANWQSQRLKMVGLIGLTLQDTKLWKIADDGFKEQVADNFEPNGTSDDFRVRDALHYHVYAVRPLLTLACAASQRGEDLFRFKASDGSTLKAAVDFVLPYVRGEKQHIEFANSSVKFDRKRAEAGEKAYMNQAWDPKTSIAMFTEAGCVDPSYEQSALKLAESKRRFIDWRMVLNAAIRDK